MAAVAGAAISSPVMGAVVPATSDENLLGLCAEYHRLNRLYSEAIKACDALLFSDTAAERQAEELSDSLSDLQDAVMLAISATPAKSSAGAKAKALAVASFFDIDSPEENAAQLMLWSLVRDMMRLPL